MKKNFPVVLAIFLTILSCSKPDDEAPIITPIDENIMGLQVYGDETNSYDESIDLFEITTGYISFENSNKYDVEIGDTYDGSANMLIRKFDDKFEMTSEFVLETNTYDILSSVAKIDENTYALAGRFSVEKDYFSYPFIKIVNDNGVVLQSLVLSGSTTFSTSSSTRVFYKDGVIYVADRMIDYDILSLIAFDVELNELWRKDFSVVGSGAIYVDDYVYFGMIYNHERTNNPEYYSITIQLLDTSDGDSVKSIELDNSVRKMNSITKIKEHNGNLYFIGGTSFGSPNFAGCILEINKNDGQVLDEIYVTSMYKLNDIAFSGNSMLVVGNSRSNEHVIKVDNEGNVLWSYKVITNTFGGELYKLISNQMGIIFNGGLRFNNSTDRSTDAIYGILDDSGKLK